MRFIPRNCIQPEAVLAKPIIGSNGEILLRAGVQMTPKYISRLQQLGINGAYVNDPISENLEIVSSLSDELRSHAVKSICSIFNKASQSQSDFRSDATELMKTAEMMVDEILSHGEVMLNLLDLKVYDSYTFFHCVNVTVLSVITGMSLNIDRDELIKLAYASLLHDIGKVFIDQNIINKNGPLTPDEFAKIKQHPKSGYDYIKDKFYINISEISARGVLDHHERLDGSGYPSGSKAGRISEFGKIIAIADVYDALVSDRPYRKAMSPVEAMEYVQGGSGTAFEHDMVMAFSKKVALFPVGTCVQLSNGFVGLVMENYESFQQRPLLKIFEKDKKPVEPFLLNLCNEAFDVTVISSVAM